MRRTLRQVRALVLLWMRSMVPTVTKRRGKAIAQNLGLGSAALIGFGGVLGSPRVGAHFAPLRDHQRHGSIWPFLIAQGMSSIRRARGAQMNLADSTRLIEALPLTQPSRLLFSLLAGLPVGMMVVSASVAEHEFRLTPLQWVAMVGNTLAILSAIVLLSASWEAARRLVRPHAPPSLFGFLEILFIGLVLVSWTSFVHGLRSTLLWWGSTVVVSLSLLYAAEKRGYDRFPPMVPTRVPKVRAFGAAETPINPASLGKLAIARSESSFWAFVTPLLLLGFTSVLTFAVLKKGEFLWELSLGSSAFVALVGLLRARAWATRLAMFDAAARPFLAPLTLEPRDLMQGRASAIRRRAMVYLLVLAPTLALVKPLGIEPVLRLALVAATLWISCSVVTSIAFLTVGPAAENEPKLPVPGGLLLLLLLTLVLGAAASPSILIGLPSLAALAALDFEARRACQRCVRWWDDPSPDAARSTVVWQAILVLGLFLTVGTWATFLFWWAPLTLRPLAGYLIAGLVVLATMWKRRDVLPALRWRPTTAGWFVALPLGLATAGLLGKLAVRYGQWAEAYFGGLSPYLRDFFEEDAKQQRGWAFGALAVVAAPIVEECFFRGWFQQAIRAELDPRWRRLAIPIAALGFAAIHPDISFPPVFALGLVLGLLYDSGGGLIAAIAAHATYNAVIFAAIR